MFVFGFRTLFYLHTSDNLLLPFTYSVKLNVGVLKQNQKSLLQAIQKPMVHVRMFGFQTLSEIRTFEQTERSKSEQVLSNKHLFRFQRCLVIERSDFGIPLLFLNSNRGGQTFLCGVRKNASKDLVIGNKHIQSSSVGKNLHQ